LPHTNQQENLEGGALRFSTVPQRKKGTRPAATSLAAAFVSTAGDKEKWLEASVGRGRKFAVAIPAICMCNPQQKSMKTSHISTIWNSTLAEKYQFFLGQKACP
jgi:hypothetical protein